MGNMWIIDVIADLKTFADQNDLPLLSQQLSETAKIAVAEIAPTVGKVPALPPREDGYVGNGGWTAGGSGQPQ
jgi:hypothetical protein